jgi:hypothetical protein
MPFRINALKFAEIKNQIFRSKIKKYMLKYPDDELTLKVKEDKATYKDYFKILRDGK